MTAALALLASPLLGPASWEPAATALRARGHDITVVAHGGPAPSSAAAVIAAFTAALDPDRDWLLVPHSNAGLLAPAVARDRSVRAIVYVDSRLPATGEQPMKSGTPLAFLTKLVDGESALPPWSRWWDGDGLGDLFPTAAAQCTCEAEMRRLPLRYFESLVDGTGWDAVASAYLAFGDGYAAERDRAAAADWPTATIEGAQHLHMLVDPAGVAQRLENLLAAISEP